MIGALEVEKAGNQIWQAQHYHALAEKQLRRYGGYTADYSAAAYPSCQGVLLQLGKGICQL
jgi:hypothetical protein